MSPLHSPYSLFLSSWSDVSLCFECLIPNAMSLLLSSSVQFCFTKFIFLSLSSALTHPYRIHGLLSDYSNFFVCFQHLPWYTNLYICVNRLILDLVSMSFFQLKNSPSSESISNFPDHSVVFIQCIRSLPFFSYILTSLHPRDISPSYYYH